MYVRQNILRESRVVLRESLLQEKYVRSVANKAASGEKYDESDIGSLFAMMVDAAAQKGASPTSTVANAGWNNLIAGLTEKDRDHAKNAYRYTTELARIEREIENLETHAPSDISGERAEEHDDRLNMLSDRAEEIEERVAQIRAYLASRHRAPNERDQFTPQHQPSSDLGMRTQKTVVRRDD